MSSEASRRATAERAARHKAEVDRLNAWIMRLLGLSVAVCIVAIVAVWALMPKGDWRTDNPPQRQKLEVVTYGWHDPKKGWCSYDTGERITVKEWR